MGIKQLKKPKKLSGGVVKKKKLVNKKKFQTANKNHTKNPSVESSPSSTRSLKKSKKRVSFSNRIYAQSPEPPGSAKPLTNSSNPVKGILKANGDDTPKSAKLKDSTINGDTSKMAKHKTKKVKKSPEFEKLEISAHEPEAKAKHLKPKNIDEKFNSVRKFGDGQKPMLMVKKSLKEKLLQMPRKERKQFIRELREKSHPNFHLTMEVKQLWEKFRSSKVSEKVKEESIQKIMEKIKGRLKELIYAHDTTRVFQTLLLLKRDEIRNALFDELVPEIVRMTKSQYARFFVTKMLKYGTRDQKDTIINAFQGHCVKIYRIVWAAEVLESAYNNHANAQQRENILSEFYGKEYILYKQSSPTLHLDKIIENDPAKKASIALNLEETLQPAVAKTTLKLTITHRLLLDFFSVCSPEQRDNMVDSLKDKIPELCITREGSRVGLICVWNSTAAERKAIVKNFKGTVLNACKHEFAHRVLLGIFDSVDDTKLVNKYILQDIGNYIADIMFEKYGQKILHYLVMPRNPNYFFKGEREMYSEGDSNIHSKKPKEIRYKELYEYIQEPLYTYLAANMKELINNKLTSMLVLNALELALPLHLYLYPRQVSIEYRKSCYQAIADVVGEEFIPHNVEGSKHIIDSGCGRYVLNNLLRADKKQKNNVKLSDYLAELPKEHLGSFVAINNGCFILKNMYESGSDKARKAVKLCVSVKALEKSSFVGAKLLLKELKGEK